MSRSRGGRHRRSWPPRILDHATPSFLCSLAGLLAASPIARADAPGSVSISVDATAVGAPLDRVWSFHGYDEINYTTSPEGRELLAALVAAHTAPVHVRSHFLFNTGDGTPGMKWGSTNVYTEDADGKSVYDWTLTDGIMDTLDAVGAFPLVELGFMPQALSRHPTHYRNASTLSLEGGCLYPPTDYTKWADLVRAWARHASERHANVEAKWLWELWNEPDSAYWHGTFEDYARLYDYTEAALHQALPNAKLGGPAVIDPQGDFLRQFIDHCAKGGNAVTGATGTRLDLVSFHAKGGVTVRDDHVQLDLGNQLRLHRAGFDAVAAFPAFKATPIYITEADPEGCAACPTSSNPANAYRNSTAYGAYEVAMMKRSLELATEVGVKLGGVLTWSFTFPDTPYFAGYRVLATNGIHLPVLSAFKLLGRLAGARLSLTSTGASSLGQILASGVRDLPDIDGMATLDGTEIRVLLWSYHDDVVATADSPVHLSVKVPSSFGARVRVSHLRVDESHGNAHTVWVSQGMPPSPSATEVAALREVMEPSSLVPDTTFAVADGVVTFDFELPRFAVSLITMRPAADTSGEAVRSGGCSCAVLGRGRHAVGVLWFGIGALAVSRVARRPTPRRGIEIRGPGNRGKPGNRP
jgi:xylan 1,4-beta-xylosidase